jgi:hypothetical protein
MGELKRCAVYICDNCGFEEPLPLDLLREDEVFKEDDLATFPKFECHGCHEYLITVKKIEDLPAEWFPDITPEEFYRDF